MSTDQKNTSSFVIGTAGHIDHGKSSLIFALSGKDPDRLIEEKERGITITLGFAQIDLGEGIFAGVVDVPGHERFVREMISGATGIDIALLCVAADDGIMPQTKEHLHVLELLGVSTCVVAITKCDVVDDELSDIVKDEVSSFLNGTVYENSEIIKVSSKEKKGLVELKQALLRAYKNTKRHIKGDTARQPVDRVFTMKGAGTVITGTLWSGQIAVGDTLEILPTKKKTRVRSIQIHDVEKQCACAGNRVALNLSNVTKQDIWPGCMLATLGTINPSNVFDVQFRHIGCENSPKPLKSGSEVHISHGTSETVGRILLLNGKKEILPGEVAFAQIRTNDKLPVSYQDRFIVRSYSPVEVIGGGVVLRCHPRKKTNLKDAEMKLLDALVTKDEDKIVQAAFELQTQPVTPKTLSHFCGLSEDVCKVCLIKLKEVDKSVCVDKKCCIFATKEIFNNCLNQIEGALKRFHAKEPNATGVSKEYLKELSFSHIDLPAFEALLGRLEERGDVYIKGGEISHRSAGAGAKVALDSSKQKIMKLFIEKDQNPPFIKDIAGLVKLDTKLCSKALTALEAEGKIVRVSKDFYFTRDVLEKLKKKVVCALEKNEGSVAELKEAMSTSRKYAVPILEYFDKIGTTRRNGDVRVLN